VFDQSIEDTNSPTGGGRCTSKVGLAAACNNSCCTLPATHTRHPNFRRGRFDKAIRIHIGSKKNILINGH
jgi:hypothetical protein